MPQMAMGVLGRSLVMVLGDDMMPGDLKSVVYNQERNMNERRRGPAKIMSMSIVCTSINVAPVAIRL
jgi:hypothetical protein